jgi:hypothetical protein
MERATRLLALPLIVAIALSGCATASGRPTVTAARGQSAGEIDRDRWECALSAQERTGADVGASLRNGGLLGLFALGAVGAGIGAVIGAATSQVAHGAEVGAVIGAAIGAPLGGSVAVARGTSARERAYHACLEGRGYEIGSARLGSAPETDRSVRKSAAGP